MKYDTLDDGRERLDDLAQTEEAMLANQVAAPLCSYWDGEHCWSLLAEPAHECTCGLERQLRPNRERKISTLQVSLRPSAYTLRNSGH